LMHLFATTLMKELPLFHQENVRLRFFGDIESLPQATYEVFQEGLRQTKDNTGMVFALAVNYGSRAEIARATKLIAQDVADGKISVDDITPDLVSSRLYTAGLPDPELLIRTSGEQRLSNYLLWQLAYTEFYVTDVLWPDFSRWDYLRAVRSFQGRHRRFGGVVNK
ncbi:MAG: polyprenyl diphosphate synthase, partial [Coriobacteriales bacterium]|nr:polyprenyl diphosphate synthase [Coriobacteriales bacterium]